MAIFQKTDPDVTAQRDAESALRSKRRDRDALVERLAISETTVTTFRAKARALAGEGADDALIAKAEAQMRSAQDRTVTLTGALADIDPVISGLEREIEVLVDRRMRVATSSAIEAMVKQFEMVAARYDSVALEFIAAARELGLIIPEAAGIWAFVERDRVQLPPACLQAIQEAKRYAAAVIAGVRAPSLPKPAAPPVVLKVFAPLPVQMMNIFAVKSLKYTNAEGVVICIGAKKRGDVPKALGELAISSGLALPISDPRCRDLAYNSNPFEPDERNCTWLGPVGPELPGRSMRPEPVPIHSSLTTFEVMDMGPAYPATFTRPPPAEPMPLAAAAGARKSDTEE